MMARRSITLYQWLQEKIKAKGIDALAKELGVTPSAVNHWRRGYVMPDTRQMRKIRNISEGRVSLDKTVDLHFSQQNKKRYTAKA